MLKQVTDAIEKASCHASEGVVYGALPKEECERLARAAIEAMNLPSSQILENGCTKAAKEGEPVFILLGRDPDAADAVDYWATLREAREGISDKVTTAILKASDMRLYAGNKGPLEKSE